MKHKRVLATILASLGLVVSLVVIAAFNVVIANPKRVEDQARVWQFTPSAAIKEQMTRDDLSPEGRFLYLASHPKVDERRAFNEICSTVTIDTSLLGCYIESTKRIYLFHETDPRVDGTEEVNAAREMLRAAWDRTTPAARAKLLVPLKQVLATNHDPDLDLSNRMKAIRDDDPSDANAELYAIVGTEVPKVGALLEANYDKYFNDRSKVTKLAAHSQAYLLALEKKGEALAKSMDALKKSIDYRSRSFQAAVKKWNADVSSFNYRADTPGGFPSESSFNVARAALIARQNSLNATAKSINGQIDVYNADIPKLKALAKIAASLFHNLNIDLTPIQSLTV